MVYPCLVPRRKCKVSISLEFTQEPGVNEYGEPLETIKWEGLCNYQSTAKRILTDQKELVEITGSALFTGDICPELAVISGGEAVVFGQKRRILQGSKARNPDGTVNYTEVLLI